MRVSFCDIIIITQMYSKVHRKSYVTYDMIIMTEIYSKVHRITHGTYDMIIMEKKQAIKVEGSLMSIHDIIMIRH